ncbi:hypothetical protein [Natronohydrobacter thiooxidans]|uniref:hypothetical protein n=1 Tax=Natronohydrobacter thiooxidans TaxID=87172 RepID=UPI0008FF4C7B|nr:hypothetical protein [Natronohydrobacter thiooxidans]
MTISTFTTIPAPTESAVSRAFTILLHRLSDLVRLEGRMAPRECAEAHEDRTNDLTRARAAVLAAAQDTLETPAEHPLDGPLNRLATLAELQMTLHCLDELTILYNRVMEHHDLFEITGTGAMDRRVRGLQQVFFKQYTALVQGSQIAAKNPDTGHIEAREAIPA